MATIKNQKFCLEISRPGDLKSAKLFRWITLLLAWIPVLLATLWWLWLGAVDLHSFEVYFVVAVLNVTFISFMATMTLVPFYTLHHPEVEPLSLHRGAILTLYCCAPLAWMFVPALILLPGLVETPHWDVYRLVLFALFSGGAIVVIATIFFVDTVRIRGRVLGARAASGGVWVHVRLLAIWLFAGFTCLVGIPGMALYIAHIYFSIW